MFIFADKTNQETEIPEILEIAQKILEFYLRPVAPKA